MSAALESLEQQYAAEVLKPDADEESLKRLKRGIRDLREVMEPTEGPTIAEQLKLVQAQQARLEAQVNQLNVQAQRSVTSAAEVGRNTMNSTFWPDSCRPHDLWNILYASESTVDDLVNDVICKPPASLQECAQLESDFRDSSENSNKTKQKRRRDTLSASSLDILAKRHVQLAWGYVLRQLQQVGRNMSGGIFTILHTQASLGTAARWSPA